MTHLFFFPLKNIPFSGTIAPLVLKNQPCRKSTVPNCAYERMFQPQTIETAVISATNATLVAFFDILENVSEP